MNMFLLVSPFYKVSIKSWMNKNLVGLLEVTKSAIVNVTSSKCRKYGYAEKEVCNRSKEVYHIKLQAISLSN